MDDIILNETIVEKNKVTFKFEVRGILKEYFTTNELFIEYDFSIEDIPISIINISFVSSILPLMWLTDTTMWIYDIDRTFYDSVPNLKRAYQDLYPNYNLKGNFISAKTTYNDYDINRESILLFSGGIDAHVSYLRIKDTNPILCNIQGWYKSVDNVDKAADADYRDISKFADVENREFRYVKSNFAVIINNSVFQSNIGKTLGDSWWHGFQHSMSFISIAIPLAYKFNIKNIYIASSFSIGNPGKCASYATTDIEFKFATKGGCIHDAFEMSRQDKVHYLVNYQKKSGKPYNVRVCSFNDENCCACDKCFRTVIEIVAENGDVHNFGFSIDTSLKDYWSNIMETDIVKFGIEGEKLKHWPDSIKRMKENYDTYNDEQKEFVDWFLNYDFIGKRKKALIKYYFKNFFKILKRKIGK